MRPLCSLLLLCATLLLPSTTQAARDHRRGLQNATKILVELGHHVPSGIREAARCVSVLTVGKGGFVFGGTSGRGFLSCKIENGQRWSAPVVLNVGGGSAGAQIGGAKVELIMVFTHLRDVEDIARTTPVFSGKASATAGDLGLGISVGGDPSVEGGVLTVSRSEGLYAGAVGEALVIKPDKRESARLLGGEASLEDVLLRGKAAVPPAAAAFIAALSAWQDSNQEKHP